MRVPILVVSCIRNTEVVSAPKASRFIKLPHRPTICPTSRPITTRSVMAKNLKPRFPLRRERHRARMTTAMTVP